MNETNAKFGQNYLDIGWSRRRFLIQSGGLFAAAGLPTAVFAVEAESFSSTKLQLMEGKI
jgi:hypothetical protein